MTDSVLMAFVALLNHASDPVEREALFDAVANELEERDLLEWLSGEEDD